MSIYSSSIFSDDELKEELRNIGFEDVPPEILSLIKTDLARYVDNELFSSNTTPLSKPESPVKTVKVQLPKLSRAGESTTSPKKRFLRKTKFLSPSPVDVVVSKDRDQSTQTKSHLSSSNSSTVHINKSCFSNQTKNLSPSPAGKVVPELHDRSTLTKSDLSSSNGSNDFYESCVSNQKVQGVASAEREKVKFRGNFFPHKLHSKSEENLSPTVNVAFNCSSFTGSPDSKSSSSCSSSEKTIKRKVLRRRNGEPVITEVLIKLPFDLETSYPESDSFDSSKSSSGLDLSPKSLTDSSGSSAVESPKPSLKPSSSVLSLTSKCSTATRILNSRKKKNDPVARYGYYKKFWDNFKPPGEKSHDKLRWAIRDKMLDYHL